jgi:hypothetical protein
MRNLASDKDLYGNDVYNSILRVYKLNSKGFEDLLQEIDNFKFIEPTHERQTEIEDLTIENPSDIDDNFEVCKIVVFEKETNKILFETITMFGADSNDIIDLISYNENPRGIFTGVEESIVQEDSDKFDETFNADNTIYNGFKINIESFDDQGDIVYMWRFNNHKRTYSDDKYYKSAIEAITIAQKQIDKLLERGVISAEPIAKCPQCDKELDHYAIYYDCPEHGRIQKNEIKWEML